MNLSKILMIAAVGAALAACGGSKSSTPANPPAANPPAANNPPANPPAANNPPAAIPTAAVKITPMKGKFAVGTTVRVKRAKDGVVVATGTIDATGSASVNIPTSETGPFLIEAGIAGDTYFDEATGANATVPPGQPALRALIPNTSANNVGVTALTEFAVGQVEASATGLANVTPTGILAANATIGSQFGVNDLLAPPTVVSAGTQVVGGTAADDYALKLAGLAKMAKSGVSSVQALHDLRDDIKDGTFDGQIGTSPLTSLVFAVPQGGMTPAALSTEIATQVQAATTTYGAAGAAVPTVTLTVQDLAALLAAAMQVGAEAQLASTGSQLTAAQLNTQIAATVNTQVGNIATQVAGGTPIATATTTAVANTTTAATALASAGGTAQADFMAGLAAGWYQQAPWLNTATPPAAAPGAPQGQITQRPFVSKTIGTSGTITNSYQAWNFVTGALEPYAAPVGSVGGWMLTATSPGGWVPESTPENTVVTTNADGTISWATPNRGTSGSFLPSVMVLDGQPLKDCASAANPTGAACIAGDVYPAGSKMYDLLGDRNNEDRYGLWMGGGVATNASGVQLATLPAVGTSFCVSDHLFRAIPSAVAGADNYDVLYTGWNPVTNLATTPGCTLANINAVNTIPSAANNRTLLMVSKATGNTAAPAVLKVQRVSQAGDVWLLNRIYGAVAGAVYIGDIQYAGPVQNNNNGGNLNKTAMDADLAFRASRTAVMRYIADATSATGVTEFFSTGLPQAAGNVTWVGVNRKWVAGATPGSYTQSMTANELTFPTSLAAPTWVAKTFLTETFPAYYMSAATTTWTVFDGVQIWTLNPDGTLSTVSPRAGSLTMDIVRTKLGGTPIYDPIFGGVIGTYPASNSNSYTQVGATSSTANYRIFVDPFDLVTDLTGAAATAVPTVGTSFCTQGKVFRPFTGTGTNNYEVLPTTGGCSSAEIAAVIGAAVGLGGQATFAQRPVLNAGAPAVWGFTGAAANNIVISAVTNGIYSGNYQPAGKTLGYIFDMSWTAGNAITTALGAPALP